MTKKRATAADVRSLLRARYAAPEFATFWEVPNATGSNIRRYADAVTMSLWPSRGLNIHGFEIKVSLADYKKEISSPDKSVAIQKFCDFWWVVAPKEAMDESLLPEKWGWLEVQSSRLVARKNAPKLETEPLTRGFVASLLRRAGEQQSADFEAEVSRRMDPQRQKIQERIDRAVKEETRRLQAKAGKYDGIVAALGMARDRYGVSLNDEEFSKAVKLVMDLNLCGSYSPLINARNSLFGALQQMDRALDQVNAHQSDLGLREAAE